MEIRTEPLPWKHKNLLLLGDEDEKMIARYLDRGTMYVLDEDGVKAGIVLTEEVFVLPDGTDGERVAEIKNLAVLPEFQRRDGRKPAHPSFLSEVRVYLFPPHRRFFYGTLPPPHRRGRRHAEGYDLSETEVIAKHAGRRRGRSRGGAPFSLF